METVPEQEGLLVLDVRSAGLDVGTAGARVRVDGAPVLARLVSVTVVTPTKPPTKVTASEPYEVSPARLPRLDGQDELQAQGRMATKKDPSTTSLLLP